MKDYIRIASLLLLAILAAACSPSGKPAESEDLPPIYPDYINITIPCNIAPLNFLLRNRPEVVEVRLKGSSKELLIRDSYKVQFSENTWRNLLKAETGNTIHIHIKTRKDGQWTEYAPFVWHVAAEPVDAYLTYRLIEPACQSPNDIQLRERNLESFSEQVIADNNLTERSCISCHIYGKQNPALSLFHIRGEKGGLILNRDGKLRKLGMQEAMYGDIHPSGRYGVFSTNKQIAKFHLYRNEKLEVYDDESDIVVLDFDRNKIVPFPKDTSPVYHPLRTFPVFSADGNAIYYCEAPYIPLPDSLRQLMYSLRRISFDPSDQRFGNRTDTIYDAAEAGMSASLPRMSPDGRYLMYTVSQYGTFPAWHHEADLQMIDLYTGQTDSLHLVNANYADTWHSWSSNSRWFVFSSKRDDGTYSKPYFSYLDSLGVPQKPFLLPQSDPSWYDYNLKSFNTPELSKAPLPFNARDVEETYHNHEAEKMSF